jgi:hypothetical protein
MNPVKSKTSILKATAFPVPMPLAAGSLTRVLDVRVPIQEQDNWCWCAITQGFANYFDRTFALKQCETAAEVLSIPDACDRSSESDVNTLYRLDLALSKFDLFAGLTGVLTFAQIKSQIDAGLPVGVHVLFEESGVSHFTAIRGYKSDPTPMLVIDDPFYDESEWSYQEFLTRYKGSGVWHHSYLTLKNTD